MVKKIAGNFIKGIIWGCFIMSIYLLVLLGISDNSSIVISFKGYLKQVICSSIVGIGFFVPSVIYDVKKISRGLQILFQLGIGFVIYFITAFYAGWIPIKNGIWTIICTVIGMVLISTSIWFRIYIYYKKQAIEINKKIKEKNLYDEN